jgi:hypothetical protein
MKHHALRLGVSLVCVAMLAVSAPLAGAGRSDDKRSDRKAANRTTTARPANGSSRMTPATIGARTTSIVGSAWNVDNSPIRFANLRLRDVIEGKIEALTKANEVGEFTFENVPAGSYVVELVNDAGKVETIGHVFSIAPGETVATFVRLSAKVPWYEAFFNNTSGAVSATAASTGVRALAPTPTQLCSSPPCND